MLQISKREAALILAAIRNWQEDLRSLDLYDFYEGYFEDVDPLEDSEIEELCRRVALASLDAD
jgi:hypothetical protein